ncbi:hypothetical protein Pmar_PMAR007939 [Perkinsus marinus ATCC 50983]|uniref:Uncharacterized protein n=1 Tax=Perkinsus marinus (strain ATCC 50983 / TXsc) TaxID=423536 RepID=C5L4S7_PERM5|nr:hypothetical protein Pmar_PMAR007939 [Perkinsus marinus ATCC 50983]EER08268.1 hypothetical protein Pmar_PMAR007939 [Perkinsus marinus ATCC 50983]|eukprot:XP_002776452.1 hypothetical protein Pmar_PMAR007939 [Perkinsus marinus ATCC 50983]
MGDHRPPTLAQDPGIPQPPTTGDSAPPEHVLHQVLTLLAQGKDLQEGASAKEGQAFLTERLAHAQLVGIDPTLVPSITLFHRFLNKPNAETDFLSTDIEDFLGQEDIVQIQGSSSSSAFKSVDALNKKASTVRIPNRLALLGVTLIKWVTAGSLICSLPRGLLLSHVAATMHCADLYGTAVALSYHRHQTAKAAIELSMGKPAVDIAIKEFNNLTAFECKQRLDSSQRKATTQFKPRRYFGATNYNYNYRQQYRSAPYDDWYSWSKNDKDWKGWKQADTGTSAPSTTKKS